MSEERRMEIVAHAFTDCRSHLSCGIHTSVQSLPFSTFISESNRSNISIPGSCCSVTGKGNPQKTAITFEWMKYHSFRVLPIRHRRPLSWLNYGCFGWGNRTCTEHRWPRSKIRSLEVIGDAAEGRSAFCKWKLCKHSFVAISVSFEVNVNGKIRSGTIGRGVLGSCKFLDPAGRRRFVTNSIHIRKKGFGLAQDQSRNSGIKQHFFRSNRYQMTLFTRSCTWGSAALA
mmetsp:Transcript_91059/g.262520  ORF Transcript_91059/g.262520 Transcript_91059/m.262520 type:complete len:229 (-) Transcript_91059:82-768(-)